MILNSGGSEKSQPDSSLWDGYTSVKVAMSPSAPMELASSTERFSAMSALQSQSAATAPLMALHCACPASLAEKVFWRFWNRSFLRKNHCAGAECRGFEEGPAKYSPRIKEEIKQSQRVWPSKKASQ